MPVQLRQAAEKSRHRRKQSGSIVTATTAGPQEEQQQRLPVPDELSEGTRMGRSRRPPRDKMAESLVECVLHHDDDEVRREAIRVWQSETSQNHHQHQRGAEVAAATAADWLIKQEPVEEWTD